MPVFTGVWVPLVTPFTADGAVGFVTLRRVVECMFATGVVSGGLRLDRRGGSPENLFTIS